MGQYLMDTNVISHYFTAAYSLDKMSFLDTVIDEVPNLSVISQIELLSWKSDSMTEQAIQAFISDSNIFAINEQVIEVCVTLRRNRKIKTPDAIIAATALAYQYTLITNNTKDFANIKGLKVISL
jgi:predicted nucleic acid-binding protein